MQTLKKTLDLIAQNKNLSQYKVGLEKESLRCQSNLKLSPKPHPSFLGSPLHNPFFTLDFAEAQLEWTTPPKNSFKSALKVLKESQRWTMTHPSKEAVAAFWPYSMPMKLDKAPPLANFGESFEATKKKLYRKGLCHRYGHPVQSICGIHFNLSFPKELFELLYEQHQPKQSLEEFITGRYFHTCRNYLRYGWLITYLFGASPFSSRQLPITKDLKIVIWQNLELLYACHPMAITVVYKNKWEFRTTLLKLT